MINNKFDRMITCKVCGQSKLVIMAHAAAPELNFLLCHECESVWTNSEDASIPGKGKSTSFGDIYGDYGWPLVEAGLIHEIQEREQGAPSNR